ncbi:helix-turn-helix domain-containing protein [Nonomuraea sp. NPDC050310]|uniref:PucR family transcriptional regulator n=1 Tax=unclassified Nonomuraea TaxID=2593643 RepID=UPI0033D5E650
MTDLKIGGQPVHRRLLHERSRLADALVARLLAENEQYRSLPAGELAHDILRVVEENLVALAEALRERRVPADVGGRVVETAVRGAEQGMPPSALIDAYHLAFAETWRAMTAQARPEELADVLECSRLIMAYTRRVSEVVTDAYFEEAHRRSAEERDERHRLLSALLNGVRVDGLAPGYTVVSLAIEDGPAVATRRRTHRMERELESFAAGALFDHGGSIALLPWSGPWAQLEALMVRLAEAARTPVAAAAAHAAPEEVPAQVRQTREVLEVVGWFGLGPGLYRLADVLLEYQLTRPTAASAELAALLDPLEPHPDLLRTLRTHLRHGRSRRVTAERLHLHPNTVDYRLRRVAALTGLDPADDAHVQRLGAALAARLANERPRDQSR